VCSSTNLCRHSTRSSCRLRDQILRCSNDSPSTDRVRDPRPRGSALDGRPRVRESADAPSRSRRPAELYSSRRLSFRGESSASPAAWCDPDGDSVDVVRSRRFEDSAEGTTTTPTSTGDLTSGHTPRLECRRTSPRTQSTALSRARARRDLLAPSRTHAPTVGHRERFSWSWVTNTVVMRVVLQRTI